jgi:Leucine-rich repeat (LRR) protein
MTTIEETKRLLEIHPYDISLTREYLNHCRRLNIEADPTVACDPYTRNTFRFRNHKHTQIFEHLHLFSGEEGVAVYSGYLNKPVPSIGFMPSLSIPHNSLKNLEFLSDIHTQKIRIINLSHNRLKDVQCLSNLKADELTHLYLDWNHIYTLPTFSSHSLKYIALEKNPIRNLKFLSRLDTPNLETLSVGSSDLYDIQDLLQFQAPKLRQVRIYMKKERLTSKIQLLLKMKFPNVRFSFVYAV